MHRKILIVDDEMHLARILQFTLEHEGYDVVTAFDGKEALDSLEREAPDLLILDLMLPIVDGYKICNMVKNGLTSKDIARSLHVSVHTINSHRNNIRRKVNINNEKVNLVAFLKSM